MRNKFQTVIIALTIFLCLAGTNVFAEEVQKQAVKVKNSYLTSVVLQKDISIVQEVEIQKSFLVRVLVKSCSCATTAKQ